MLLTERGELRVTDFGIAKHKKNPEDKGEVISIPMGAKHLTATITGTELGTPEYSAPEQWGQAGEADARADIYALGGVLFELCCGRRPFDKRHDQEHPYVLIGRHLFTPVPDPRIFNKEIPETLAELIVQCLAKAPHDRASSMASVSQAEAYRGLTLPVTNPGHENF